ncbi:hypothetical protein OQA88_3235 [Cercophora sp. LCS_1]
MDTTTLEQNATNTGRPSAGFSQDSSSRLPWACPFQKASPGRFSRCSRGFREVRRVKEHIYRKHKHIHCVRCYMVFEAKEILRDHLINDGCSSVGTIPPVLEYGISDATEGILRRRPQAGSSEEARWYDMWGTIFPDAAQPATPCFLGESANVLYGTIPQAWWYVFCFLVATVDLPLAVVEEPVACQSDVAAAVSVAAMSQFIDSLRADLPKLVMTGMTDALAEQARVAAASSKPEPPLCNAQITVDVVMNGFDSRAKTLFQSLISPSSSTAGSPGASVTAPSRVVNAVPRIPDPPQWHSPPGRSDGFQEARVARAIGSQENAQLAATFVNPRDIYQIAAPH